MVPLLLVVCNINTVNHTLRGIPVYVHLNGFASKNLSHAILQYFLFKLKATLISAYAVIALLWIPAGVYFHVFTIFSIM